MAAGKGGEPKLLSLPAKFKSENCYAENYYSAVGG